MSTQTRSQSSYSFLLLSFLMAIVIKNSLVPDLVTSSIFITFLPIPTASTLELALVHSHFHDRRNLLTQCWSSSSASALPWLRRNADTSIFSNLCFDQGISPWRPTWYTTASGSSTDSKPQLPHPSSSPSFSTILWPHFCLFQRCEMPSLSIL